MQTWDYRVVTCENPEQFEAVLNEQGANGWELVSSVNMTYQDRITTFDKMFFMFKRPKDESGIAAAITFGGDPVSREFTAPSG